MCHLADAEGLRPALDLAAGVLAAVHLDAGVPAGRLGRRPDHGRVALAGEAAVGVDAVRVGPAHARRPRALVHVHAQRTLASELGNEEVESD